MKGIITFVSGKVGILRAGESEWRLAKLNDVVFVGDAVKSLAKSRAEIRVTDDRVLTSPPTAGPLLGLV